MPVQGHIVPLQHLAKAVPIDKVFTFEAMNLKFLLREPWPRIVGIPLLGMALCTVFNDPPYTPLKFVVSILITGTIWQGDYMIISWLRRSYPRLESTQRRLLITIALVGLYNTTADLTLCRFLNGLIAADYDVMHGGMYMYLFKNMGITFVVGAVYEAGYYFERWKKQALETEAFKNRQLRAELDVLRSQLSPHFLFNSLNTLLALIPENPEKAIRFTEKLSSVYRYTLTYGERDVVRLRTELEFLEAYFYLLKMRFEQGLHLDVDLTESIKDSYIAPLTLQMLVENAVKHNIVSAHKPLHIRIYSENGATILVRNNHSPRQTTTEGTRLGLANICKRYLHLSNEPVDVIRSAEHFTVALPLLSIETARTEAA
jgi:hypothetical protein